MTPPETDTNEAPPPGIDTFAVAMLAEVMAHGSSLYWQRRARTFLDARPRPDDFLGASTLEDQRARWRRMTERANACMARAEVARRHETERHVAEAGVAWAEAA